MRLTLGSTQMGEGEGWRLKFENTDRAYRPGGRRRVVFIPN